MTAQCWKSVAVAVALITAILADGLPLWAILAGTIIAGVLTLRTSPREKKTAPDVTSIESGKTSRNS